MTPLIKVSPEPSRDPSIRLPAPPLPRIPPSLSLLKEEEKKGARARSCGALLLLLPPNCPALLSGIRGASTPRIKASSSVDSEERAHRARGAPERVPPVVARGQKSHHADSRTWPRPPCFSYSDRTFTLTRQSLCMHVHSPASARGVKR